MKRPIDNGGLREFYVLTLDFNVTIPANSSAQAYAQVDTSGPFFIQSMRSVAWVPAAVSTTIALTPLSPNSSNTLASNTFPTLAHCRLMLEVSGVQWFSNPTKLNLLSGDSGNPFFFQTLPALALQAQLVGTLYNDSANDIQAQIAFNGYKLLN